LHVHILTAGGSGRAGGTVSKSAGPLRGAGGQAAPPPGRGGGTTSKLLTSLSAAEIKLQGSRSSSSLTSKVQKLLHGVFSNKKKYTQLCIRGIDE